MALLMIVVRTVCALFKLPARRFTVVFRCAAANGETSIADGGEKSFGPTIFNDTA